MQVSYRGISYEINSPVLEGVETEQTGMFLGKRFKLKQYTAARSNPASQQLKYRGVDYQQ